MSSIRRPFRRFAPLLAAAMAAVSATGADEAPVRLVGLESIDPADAREWIETQIAFVESSGVSMAGADDLAYFLENALRERGYNEATVDWRIERGGAEKTIVLDVTEGTPRRLGEVDVTGNQALEDAAVFELLTDATRGRTGLDVDDPLPYVASDIRRGRNKVEEFHRLLGFRDVETTMETSTAGNRTRVDLAISEGVRHRVGAIEFPEPPTPAIAEAYETIRTDFGERNFNGTVPGSIESRLRSAAVNAGYYRAGVEVEETASERRGEEKFVDLVVTADWGRLVDVSSVSVEGNEKVDDAFFRRHFAPLVNQPYSPEEANTKVEELLETGAFETVRTDVVEAEDGSFRLDVEVEEGYSRTLGVYAGFTNYEGPIGGFEFRNLNLFGSVRTARGEIELSRRGARGELEYTDPWFLDSDYRFNTGIFAINREEEGYEKFETGGRYEFTRRFGKENRNLLSFFGRAGYTDIRESQIDPMFLGDTEYLAHFVGVSLTHDRRDQPRSPTSGFLAQGSLSAATSALGSEVEFLKATGRLGYYLPVGEHTLRLAARGGAITPTGDTDAIPIDLRFFNGGPNSVRSFQERALGPRDPASGFEIGGQFFTVFNLEYEIPIGAVEGLSVVPFADAGNLLRDADDAGLDRMRYAVGLGLRYRTPIGPIRLEYGHNPDQQPGDPDGTFHVGFGFSY